MATEQYRNTYSWKLALGFGKALARLGDDLPQPEGAGLVQHLLTAAVDLGSAVGCDLRQDSNDREAQLVRLYALIGVVEAVYPALDVTAVTSALDKLDERLSGEGFSELIASPRSANEEAEEADALASEPGEGTEPEVAAPQPPAPATVHVTPTVSAATPAASWEPSPSSAPPPESPPSV